ncbi:cytochrome P450 [Mycena haematopus]|nr:cytochrome P450 [Mycena haematopus]
MSFPSADTSPLLYILLAGGTAILWLCRRTPTDPVPPLVEVDGLRPWSYYTAAYQFFKNSSDPILQGYLRDRNGVFRIPRFFRWDYLANGADRISEVAAAREDVLSIAHGVEETLQVSYMMGSEIRDNPYHHHTVQTTLTRNLARCIPQVKDEIVCAFDDVLPLKDGDWSSFAVLPSAMRVVARTTNRLFVGLPLCRDQRYLNISIAYTIAVFKRCKILSLFPRWMRPVVGPLMSPKREADHRIMEFLGPVIGERFAKEEELGTDWPDKPNDLISWLMQDAAPEDKTVLGIAHRVLILNMAAIHTSTMALVNALFDLTTYPSHIEPMREEVERVVGQDGWTKAALNNMHLVDSFIRESQRLNGTAPVAMNRKVVAKDGFKFSDGTVIPFGSFLSTSGRAVQHDPEHYDHPELFDGFRFARMREDLERNTDHAVFKDHMVSTSPTHLAFGYGRHACPGRFFAATELKLMLAHILITYDVKAENELGVRPPDYSFGRVRSPNPTARILIRKRQRKD